MRNVNILHSNAPSDIDIKMAAVVNLQESTFQVVIVTDGAQTYTLIIFIELNYGSVGGCLAVS